MNFQSTHDAFVVGAGFGIIGGIFFTVFTMVVVFVFVVYRQEARGK
jgi:uncharacterized membrane protein YoaK (UPF0700 family)